MSKEMTLIALGIWVIIVPYLGVPGSWRTTILLATGAAVIALGLMLRRDALSHGVKRTHHHPFVESHPPMKDANHRHESQDGIHPVS